MTFLQDCANMTPGAATQISFPALAAANFGDLLLLRTATVPNIRDLFRRQAALLALDDEARGPSFLAHLAVLGTPDPGFLASINLAIRSSHSGTPIDPLLPQGPYLAAPPAGLVGMRGPANYAWLRESITDHTANPAAATGLVANPNRVPSYFEAHVPVIRGDFGLVKLNGGRLCYDPFNHRMFVSAHYLVQHEVINLPPLNANPVYGPLRAEIQAHAAALAAGGPAWGALYDDLITRMETGLL
jgi:hypothetical protein